jgi:hypothetical protein
MTRARLSICGAVLAMAAILFSLAPVAEGAKGRVTRARPSRQAAPSGIQVRVEERSSGPVYVVQFDDDPVPLVGATGVNGTIIPLYTRPSDASWSAVVAAKRAHPAVPAIAIINPADGPGPSAEAAYTAGIARLTGAGVKVIGYVHTGYGHRDLAEVESEIDRYGSWYPGTTGIFLDEMASAPGFEFYYEALDRYAKSLGNDLTVGNPGTDLPPTYQGTADIFIIREADGLPAPSVLNRARVASRASLGAICYGVPTVDRAFVAAVRPHVGYIYLQSGRLPNPWGSVPRYLPELFAALD